MTAMLHRYRGISVNIEMLDGRFVPSIHDPLRHRNHGECALPECVADSPESAEANAERWIDHSIAGEVIEDWRRFFGTKEAR